MLKKKYHEDFAASPKAKQTSINVRGWRNRKIKKSNVNFSYFSERCQSPVRPYSASDWPDLDIFLSYPQTLTISLPMPEPNQWRVWQVGLAFTILGWKILCPGQILWHGRENVGVCNGPWLSLFPACSFIHLNMSETSRLYIPQDEENSTRLK